MILTSEKKLFWPRLGLGLCLLLLLVLSCEKQSKYEQLVQNELSKGVRYDSLFLGYAFGMEVEDFFEHSWQLNKKGVVFNGGANTIEHYSDELKSDVTMSFYPRFYNNKIYKMPVGYRYDAWAPWNKQYWADSLQKDLLDLYESKYGQGFIELRDSTAVGKKYVKIDGNREIVIRVDNPFSASVIFTDLLAEQKIRRDPNPNLR